MTKTFEVTQTLNNASFFEIPKPINKVKIPFWATVARHKLSY